MTPSPTPADGGDFVLTRRFRAPRDLMFRVWTEPEHLQQWFSPQGFVVIAATMDFRPGGSYHYGLRAPDGSQMWGKWVFREIDPPARLVFINAFSDAQGGLTRHPYAPQWPLHLLSTIRFDEDADGWTTVTLRWAPHDATPEERAAFDAARPGMQQGWGGTMQQLEQYLAQVEAGAQGREIVTSRLIRAPREKVFAAWTTPQAIGAWWGPHGFTTTTRQMDLRSGGSWHFTMHGPDGRDYPNRIAYEEVAPPERLVYRHTGEAGTEPVRFHTTVTFEARGDHTLLTMRAVFATAAERDEVERSHGAVAGAHQTIARLAQQVEAAP